MNKERYDMCKKFIEECRWDIDVVEGVVIGKRGGIGRPDGSSGYLKHTVSYMGKNYNFRDHEIIAIAGGMYPVDTTIDHINGNKLDNRVSNLEWADDCRQQHEACLLGLKPTKKHILTEDEIDRKSVV